MDYKETDKVRLKLAHAKMLANLDVELADKELLSAFFDTYVRLNPEEEIEFHNLLKTTLDKKEVANYMEFTSTYHEKGRIKSRTD